MNIHFCELVKIFKTYFIDKFLRKTGVNGSFGNISKSFKNPENGKTAFRHDAETDSPGENRNYSEKYMEI